MPDVRILNILVYRIRGNEIMNNIIYTDMDYVCRFIRPRPKDTHKGNCGRILIVAGSEGMCGAAILCAMAALRSGAGLVTVAIDEKLFPIIQTAVPEAMCISRERIMDDEDDSYLKQFSAIAIGPGIGVSETNYRIITKIMDVTDCVKVIDADALNTLCRYDEEFSLTRNNIGNAVITPHPGEADRILTCAGESRVSKIGREQAVIKLADFTGATVLLKGNGTLVTKKSKEIACNTTGNPGMATGGSGDVLTGVIASLCGIGYNGYTAARIGAFMHGMAGDIAALSLGEWGMTAMDIVKSLPQAFKEAAEK